MRFRRKVSWKRATPEPVAPGLPANTLEAAPTGSPSAVSRTASSGYHYTLWDHLLPLEPPGGSRPAATDPAYLASRGTFPRPDNRMVRAVRNAVKLKNKRS